MKARTSLALAAAWATFTVASMFIRPVRESLPLIYFMSGYAIVGTHLSEWAGHRSEEKTARRLALMDAKLDAILVSHGHDPTDFDG